MTIYNASVGSMTAAIRVTGVWDTPQIISGFAEGEGITFNSPDRKEIKQGIQGEMISSVIPSITEMTITLFAPSPSSNIFTNWFIMDTARDISHEAYMTLTYPSLNRKIDFMFGALKNCTLAPNMKKTIDSAIFIISWGKVSQSIIN